jgi:copper chaperone CopZ
MKATIIIGDMHCSNCAITLESIEDELPGITHLVASYQKQSMTVQFEPNVIDVSDIIQEIHKKGYSVKSYQLDN